MEQIRTKSIEKSIKSKGLLVLGIGNDILCDDAAGLHALRAARDAIRNSGGHDVVEFKELSSGGIDLMEEFTGFDELIVVDSYFSEDSMPGRVRVLSEQDLEIRDASPGSSHLLGLSGALDLSRKLGYPTPRLAAVVVVDVGARCREFGEELSPEAALAVPEAARAIRNLVRRQGDGRSIRRSCGCGAPETIV